MLDYKRLEQLEVQGGTAALSALSKIDLDEGWVRVDPAATGSAAHLNKREAVPALAVGSALNSFHDFDLTTTGSDD